MCAFDKLTQRSHPSLPSNRLFQLFLTRLLLLLQRPSQIKPILLSQLLHEPSFFNSLLLGIGEHDRVHEVHAELIAGGVGCAEEEGEEGAGGAGEGDGDRIWRRGGR